MKLRVMVVGGGGREHAVVRALAKSPLCGEIFAVPGNGGIRRQATCLPVSAEDIPGLVASAQENAIDFAVVTPDDPLVAGAVDALEAAGISCFGPDAKAAAIEGSKVFAKELMAKYGIPTAGYRAFSDAASALSYVQSCELPVVVKADGLAKGKGVLIAETQSDAENAVRSCMQDLVFGDSGKSVVIEEFLTGPEVTVLTFTDGETLVPMVSSMDFKRAEDGDRGKNTGGMGAIAPNPFYTPAIEHECMEKIFLPTIRAMKEEGRTFKGCLYFGLMLTPAGPKVIEYNCRFGDPETQVILPLLENDLLKIMIAVREGRLSEVPVKFAEKSSCCVVMASEGYPGDFEKGFPISLPPEGSEEEKGIYIAGATFKDGKLLTSGGRVLCVSATANTLREAVEKAYSAAEKVSFKNAYYRKDIGRKAVERSESKQDTDTQTDPN